MTSSQRSPLPRSPARAHRAAGSVPRPAGPASRAAGDVVPL